MRRFAHFHCAFLLALATAGAASAGDSESTADVGCAAFSAPAVAVNPFDRTQSLDDLYTVVAKPGAGSHWDFSVKKQEAGSDAVYDGAPHSQPEIVIYGGKPDRRDINDAVLYVVTNDGSLRALDPKTGAEQWAYSPQDAPKRYSPDSRIRVLKYDTNDDGVVDPTDDDRVILFFGEGRAGDRYYAVDVTYKKPQFLWAIGPTTAGLGSIGQTWSTPTIARVSISNVAQNSQKLVLIFGGGHDATEESVTYRAADARGNAIYMVDALKGTVLWSAGRSGTDLILKRMDHAIPSDVAVLDLDGDGYADRMYVGDTAAQLWRFDIFNGMPATELVAGGVIASLGAHEDATHANAAARRFYNAPDVAAIRRKGMRPFFNIAIGSGYREHPLSTDVQDRFYSIRDYHPFDRLNQKQYDEPARRILADEDLLDVSANVGASATPVASKTVATNDAGWKVLLNSPGGSWVGEKVLAAATTFNGQILFPTFTPARSLPIHCVAGAGSNRIYTLDVFDGSGQYASLSQKGIAPQVTVLFPDQSGNRAKAPHHEPVLCLSGTERLRACRNFNPLVKTYWSESDAK